MPGNALIVARTWLASPLGWAGLAILVALTPARAATGSYPRLEAAFNVAAAIADPFDHVAADVRVQFVAPDGRINSLPAFFDGGTTWPFYLVAGEGYVPLDGLTLAPAAVVKAKNNSSGQNFTNMYACYW